MQSQVSTRAFAASQKRPARIVALARSRLIDGESGRCVRAMAAQMSEKQYSPKEKDTATVDIGRCARLRPLAARQVWPHNVLVAERRWDAQHARDGHADRSPASMARLHPSRGVLAGHFAPRGLTRRTGKQEGGRVGVLLLRRRVDRASRTLDKSGWDRADARADGDGQQSVRLDPRRAPLADDRAQRPC